MYLFLPLTCILLFVNERNSLVNNERRYLDADTTSCMTTSTKLRRDMTLIYNGAIHKRKPHMEAMVLSKLI